MNAKYQYRTDIERKTISDHYHPMSKMIMARDRLRYRTDIKGMSDRYLTDIKMLAGIFLCCTHDPDTKGTRLIY